MAKKQYKKHHKGRIRGVKSSGYTIEFGDFGLKALEPFRITAKQIESCRKVIRGGTKRVGKLWIRVFPDIPVTAKPLETRMGKGKGAVDHLVCRIHPGTMLFEISGVSEELARGVFAQVSSKLPVKSKFIKIYE